jgi:hypothetical protein
MFVARDADVAAPNANLISKAYDRLTQVTEWLLRDVTNGVKDSPHYDTVRELLKTVPLSTDEYGLATQRLKNAWQYAIQGERGAARYELALLVRNLAQRRQNERAAL